MQRKKEMELEHFNHEHPLIFNEELQIDGEKLTCFGCTKLISGPGYGCTQCHFYLDKNCAELPREIKQPLHRKHPLILLMVPPYDSGACLCDLCDKGFTNSIYSCIQCGFDLDINCALPPCVIEPAGNAHQFLRLVKTMGFICDACGTEGDQSPYMCTLCQLMVHKQCISLPRIVRITEHDHCLTHAFFLQENELAQAPYCGICLSELNTLHGEYYCSDCNYVAHVKCAIPLVISEKVQGTNPDAFTKESTTEKNKLSEEVVATVEHFTHEHDLTIIDEVGNSKSCDACMLPTFAPIYGCAQCDIFLHKQCSELPTKRIHPLHQHNLNLLPKAPVVDGVFKCDACDQYCHGFCYKCDRCDFYLDVRCSSIQKSLKHNGHQHLLNLILGKRSYGCYCSACYSGKFTYFQCAEYCNFTLDFGCATLPDVARHRFDDHPLKLNCHFVNDDSSEHYCEICEKEIDPSGKIYDYVPWFYRCEECDNSFHPECVIGRYPYIRLGGACSYDFHQHPLTLAHRKKHYPPCNNCAEPFFVGEKPGVHPSYDLALECTQCNFVIHRKGPCFTQFEKTRGAMQPLP